jgi:sulfopropanediol 3-dehydrogenase
VAGASWQNNGKVIVADSPEEAVLPSDQWASEHLEVQTTDWRYYLNHCKNYSSMFCGEEITVS